MALNEEKSRAADLRYKRWSVAISGLGVLGMLASIYFGFKGLQSQWETQNRNIETQNRYIETQNRNIENQWRQEFYKERLRIYSRATEAAARVAALSQDANSTEANGKEFKRAVIEFNTLFWGPMCITEGEEVEEAMVRFAQGLTNKLPAEKLMQLALRLAHVCKNEAIREYTKGELPASVYGSNIQILRKMKEILGGE